MSEQYYKWVKASDELPERLKDFSINVPVLVTNDEITYPLVTRYDYIAKYWEDIPLQNYVTHWLKPVAQPESDAIKPTWNKEKFESWMSGWIDRNHIKDISDYVEKYIVGASQPESDWFDKWQAFRTDAISEMFDNVNVHGIYPTGVFFGKIDEYVKTLVEHLKQEVEDEKWLKEKFRKVAEEALLKPANSYKI